jgi:hypothetical protein
MKYKYPPPFKSLLETQYKNRLFMKAIEIAFWSEIFGRIHVVQEFEEYVIAQIGKNPVMFPIELGQKLRSLMDAREVA